MLWTRRGMPVCGPRTSTSPPPRISPRSSRATKPTRPPADPPDALGLLPSWTKAGPDGGPPATGPRLINARAETVTTSPAYRSAAQHKRCLILMDGYYEWKPNSDNPKRGRKTPFYFYRADGRPLLVAGLWSVWRPDPGGRERSDSG